MHRILLRAGLPWLAASLLLTACGGGSDDLADRTNAAEPQLRLIHAAPLTPAVTLYRNNAPDAESTNLSYKGYSNYHSVTFGANALSLRLASSTDTELATANADTQRGRKYTAVAVPNGVDANLLLIDDPFTKPVGNDQARIRVVNASTNATPVDVYVTAPNADLTSRSPDFAGVAFEQAVPSSGNDSTQFTDGNYQLRIAPAGNKTAFFNTTLTLAKNDDIVLVTVPSDSVSLSPNDVHVLLVKATDTAGTATEIASQ